MEDIAKAAGVSIATVGRVIHNNGYVSREARARVETAVRELGYVPNALARALKKNRSGVIGSLVVYNFNNLYQKINDSVIEDDRLSLAENALLPEGVIKLSVGKKRHALIKPV